MWPPESPLVYEKLTAEGDSERSPSTSRPSEASSPSAEKSSIAPSYKNSRLLPYWLAVGFIAASALLVGDVALRMQNISRQVKYIKTPLPEFPVELVYFKVESPWLEPPNPQSNLRWMEEIGPGAGYVGIRNPREYDLEPGIPGYGGENFGISMFHSMHCLILIRQAWWESLKVGENISYYRTNLDSGYQLGEKHVSHCLDYVRRSIKCAGDMTLEWAAEEGSHRLNAMDGEVHKCRNFDSIREYVDANAPFRGQLGEGLPVEVGI